MGLFDKIFKGGKKTGFTETEELMPEDNFWEIIKTTYEKSGGDFEKQQEALKEALRKFTPQEVLLFDNTFRQLRGNAYDWKLWGAIYVIHGGCADDSFNDFRGWLIAQGKDFYYRTLQDPETLINVDQDRIEVDWEGMGYIPAEIFEELTGQEMPNGFKENQDIKGEEWKEDGDDLKRMFPKLYAKYS
jgi:hypothetical protein